MTRRVVLTWRTFAVIYILAAIFSRITWQATAVVVICHVSTVSTVFAWVAATFIDVYITVVSFITYTRVKILYIFITRFCHIETNKEPGPAENT